EDGIALGLTIIILLVAPQIWWFSSGSIPAPDIQQAAYAVLLAILMYLSYYYESKSFLFRWVMWTFTHFHVPRGRWLALIYCLVFMLGAIWRFSLGVGWL